MITARELVFYIRAEDQASRVVKRAARSFGSLSSIRGLEQKAVLQQAANLRQVEQAQLAIRRNQTAISRAEASAARMGSTAATRLRKAAMTRAEALNIAATQNAALLSGSLGKGTTAAVSSVMAHEAALSNVENLRKQEELLGQDLDEVRRKGTAASAAIDAQVSAAKIARVENYITAIQGVARAFRLLGIAAAASLAFAAHAAAQFQTQATLAATQSTVAGKNTTAQVLANSKFLQREILKLEGSGKVTSSLADQTNAAYQVFSSVTLRGNQNEQLKEGISLLKQFNQVATANFGMVDLNQVTKAGIVLMNRFHISVTQMPAALNRMQAAVRYGAMNMAQFVSGFNQVAPAFNAAGYSFNQMASTMAFVSRKFPNVAMGFTGLARLTETLANPKMLAGFKAQGIAVTDLTGHLLPLDVIIGKIIAKNPKLAKGGVNLQNYFKNTGGLQSTVQSRRVFVSLAQDLPGYRRMIKDVIGDNNELTKSWRAMQQSPQVQWTEFTNKLKTVVYEIGIYAIPAIATMGQYLGKAVKWFDGLSEGTKKTIAVVGTLGSVITVVATTLIIFAGAIAKAFYAFKLLKLERLASEAGIATPEIALLVLALAALGAVLYKDPHLINQMVSTLGGLKTVLTSIGILIAGLTFQKILTGLTLTASEAAIAGEKVGLLQTALLGLRGLSPYIIAVAVLYEPIKKLSKDFEKRTHSKLDFPVIGPVFEAGGELGHKTGKAFDNWLARIYPTWKQRVDQMHKRMRRDAMLPVPQIQITAMQAPATLETILSSRMASDFQKAQARLALIKRDYGELARILRSVTLPQLGGLSAPNKASVKAIAINKDAEWQKLFANVIRLDKALSDGKVHTVKQYQELLDAEDKLQKASTGNQYQAAQQMLSALESTWNTAEKSATKHQKNLLKIEKQNVQNAKTELGNLLQGVQSIYDNLLSQNQSMFGELFGGPVINGARVQDRLQFGGQVTGTDLLKDLQAQNFQFNQVNKQLDTLSKRGAPKAFLDQVKALGQNAFPDVKALMKLTPAQFRDYIKTWNAGQAAIKSNTMSQLNGQLKIYEKFGRKVAAAILKGIKSENVGLQNELQNIILKMFPGLAKQAKEVFKFKKVPATPKMPKLPAHDVVPRGRRLQSAADSMYKLPGRNPGLVQEGNLDLLHRKIARVGNAIETVHSISIGVGKYEVLIPTVINGIAVSAKAAIAYFRKTGQNLGVFKSIKDANAYAVRLHKQQAEYYKSAMKSVKPLEKSTRSLSAATHIVHNVRNAATTLSSTRNINNINTATHNLTIHGAIHTITNNAGTINNNYVNNSRTITHHVSAPARQPIVKVTGPAQVNKNTTKNVEEHTHYHITAPTSEHASIRTMIKHTDFSIRNKFKGNL